MIFLSARVHPGEVPGSHLLNGMLDFLADEANPEAQALLGLFVVKIIPMLNPDGVARGHYRLDTLGQNLNRFYENPDPQKQPSIFAAKTLVKNIYSQR